MKCNRYLAVFLATLMLSAGQASSTQASLVPQDLGFFNTGVDASGSSLPLAANSSSDDLHYQLTSAPSGVTLTARATAGHPNWLANNSTSQWITPANYASTSGSPSTAPAGLYTYTLSVTGSSSLVVTGRWATDNEAILKLNGTNVSTSPSNGFLNWTNFSLSGFTNGLNTLTFEVTNGVSSLNPTGLRVEFLTAVVPEASTIAVWSVLSLVGAGVAYRKRTAKA